MNRVFAAMVLVAFGWAAVQEVTWSPPPPQPAAIEAPIDAAVEKRLARLEARVDKHPLFTSERAPDRRPMQALTDGMLDTARSAFLLALSLVGVMTFLLGVMRVAEAAGMLQGIARVIRPVMVRLFPEVPADHPAMGAMIMNLSANALGLGNAATPFGIKAMQELQKLNRHPTAASNEMALFLAINTASITLVPTTVIGWRLAVGSHDAPGILPTTLFASTCATTMAIVSCRLLQRFWSLPPGPGREIERPEREAAVASAPLWASMLAIGGLIAAIPLAIAFGKTVGPWIVPVLAAGVLGVGAVRGVAVYEQFVAGAREGVEVGLKITPYLVAVLVAVNMLVTSGVMGGITSLLSPVTSWFGLPAEALPMALIRPLSGSGATGVMLDAMRAHGPDSYVGYLVSTIQGSTETTFYVLAVYFGAVQVADMRHAPWVGLIADAAGVAGAITAVKLYFYWNGM